jgi:large subunit ribosomal protein L43
MCTRGVYQLRKLSLYFCDFGGSSAGVREALASEQLKQFIKENEHIDFNFIIKRNHHPFVTGAYINGYLKDMPLRSYKEEEVIETLNSLRNQLGRRAFKVSGTRVYQPVQSVQGQWMPNMFNTFPKAELEKVHHIPRAHFQEIEKRIVDRRFRKSRDDANVLLGFDDYNAKDDFQA